VPATHVFRDGRLTDSRSRVSAVRHGSAAHPSVGSSAPSCESAYGRRRAGSVALCGAGSSRPTTAGNPVGARDDRIRLDDDERRSPSRPEAREHHPKPTVRVRELQPWTSSALQHLQLVPQGQDFQLERGALTHPCSEGQEERDRHRHHRPEAYASSGATSTAATRTDFSVGTRAESALKAWLAKRLAARFSEVTCSYRCRTFHTVTTQVATPVQPQRVRAIGGECICSIK
jgi:hypothetical protein